MGMFDSFYDEADREWQTKSLACVLDVYRVGDAVPDAPNDCQLPIIGDEYRRSYATIRNGILVSIDDPRDQNLPEY